RRGRGDAPGAGEAGRRARARRRGGAHRVAGGPGRGRAAPLCDAGHPTGRPHPDEPSVHDGQDRRVPGARGPGGRRRPVGDPAHRRRGRPIRPGGHAGGVRRRLGRPARRPRPPGADAVSRPGMLRRPAVLGDPGRRVPAGLAAPARTTGAGVTSVVIAARNEAAVLGRRLDARLPAPDPPDGAALDITVVANGCTDATAAVARARPGVRVIELAEGSKPAALNAGDAAAVGWPRVYLDADIVLSAADIHRLAAAVADGPALAAVPRR